MSDDDDLYFPWRISAAARAMSCGHKWSYPQWVMSDGGGQLQPEKTGGNLQGSIVISTDLLQEAGG